MPNTREKLIELLADSEYMSFENKANYLIDAGVTVQEWISVKDRLPKEDEDVIAFCHYHESWQVQVCHLSSNYEWQWYTSVAGQWVRVTLWMPLPEPPKGE